ncbi:MAG: response regulator [Lentisphaerae bacterium]|nr:MAG: response regulator [Lentisphaerota bacterium]
MSSATEKQIDKLFELCVRLADDIHGSPDSSNRGPLSPGVMEILTELCETCMCDQLLLVLPSSARSYRITRSTVEQLSEEFCIHPSSEILLEHLQAIKRADQRELEIHFSETDLQQKAALLTSLYIQGKITILIDPEAGDEVSFRKRIFDHLASIAWYQFCLDESTGKELLHMRRIWQWLTDDAPLGIRICHGDGRIIFISSHGQKLFSGIGVGSHENLYDSLQELNDIRSFQNAITGILLGKFAETSVEWCVTPPNAKTHYLRTRIRRLGDMDELILLVDEDITEYELLLNANHKLRIMAEAAHFAHGAAHDINNILSAIVMNLELIEALSPEQQSAITNCNKMALEIRDLTNGILQLGKISQEEIKPVCVHDIINECIKFLLQVNRFPNVRINGKLAAPTSTVRAKPALLKNALLNLGLNALRAVKDNGSIDFMTHTLPIIPEKLPPHFPQSLANHLAVLEITVKDNGCGIPSHILPHIFEESFTTQDGIGHGYGLGNSKRTIEQLGGCIYVESKEGSGTSFHIILPLVEENGHIPETSESYSQPSQLVLPSEDIIIVDDERSVCEITASTLDYLGMKAHIFTHPSDALAFIRSHPGQAQYFLIDYRMPGINGHELALRIQEIIPQAKIIITTGGPKGDELEKLLKDPRIKFMAKPFGVEELKRILADLARME